MSTHALRPVAASPAIEAPPVAATVPAAEFSPAPKRHPLLRRAGPAVALVACGALLLLLVDLLSGLDLSAVAASALATPPRLIVLSLLLSAGSYAALVGYDVFGVRAATDKPVPFRTIAVGSFTSYAVGHTLGFPLVTAGAVRWRIYGGAGLTLGEVAKLTAVAALTLWTGMAAGLGASASLEP